VKVPDLEGMVQEGEDQAYGNAGLVRSLQGIRMSLGVVADTDHIYPQALQARAEQWCEGRGVDPMPGLKAIMARYHHDGMDGFSYRVGKLRDLISTIMQETIVPD
jgi:hypothetical protein